MDILEQLFTKWDLGTWANILEIFGFAIAVTSLIVSFFIKSEINRLKTSYSFDKRARKHIQNLQTSASNLNQFLNDYDNNRHAIRTEFSNCIAELEDIVTKVSYWQAWKSNRLISFLKSRQNRPFVEKVNLKNAFIVFVLKYPNRLYKTTYDDVWTVYDRLIEIIRQMENIKQNKDKSL